MNRFLHEIEFESAYYNMKLNKGKCEAIEMNKRFNVKFWDGTEMSKAEAVTYLGGSHNESQFSCRGEQSH